MLHSLPLPAQQAITALITQEDRETAEAKRANQQARSAADQQNRPAADQQDRSESKDQDRTDRDLQGRSNGDRAEERARPKPSATPK
jgi:hypothetical protein